MLHSQLLRAGLGLLTLTVGACASAPPSPLAEDHPASIHAPAAPVQTEPLGTDRLPRLRHHPIGPARC